MKERAAYTGCSLATPYTNPGSLRHRFHDQNSTNLEVRIQATNAIAAVKGYLDREDAICLDAFVVENELAAEIAKRLDILPRKVTEAVRHALDVIASLLSEAPVPERLKASRQIGAIVTPDGDFASTAEAASHFGISRQAVHQKVSSGWHGWAYKDRPSNSEAKLAIRQ